MPRGIAGSGSGPCDVSAGGDGNALTGRDPGRVSLGGLHVAGVSLGVTRDRGGVAGAVPSIQNHIDSAVVVRGGATWKQAC